MEQHSKDFERYLKWYKRGSITREQLEGLRDTGIITAEEFDEIIASKEEP